MRLTFNQIKNLTQGAEYLTQNNGYIQFHRFTEEQEKYYSNHNLHPREYVTSGVTLRFITDSKKLIFKVHTEYGSPSLYFAHDIFKNGEKIGVLANFTEADLPIKYDENTMLPIGDFKLGDFEGEYDLGEGMKEIKIVFPWGVVSMLKEISLDDASIVEPVETADKMLVFGDSITYGASAAYPSNRYSAKIADLLNSEEICKGIGGEVFCPDLIEARENVKYVLVAYGTNEYDMDAFKTRCKEFFKKLSNIYADATIIAVTPLWRADCNEDINTFERIKTVTDYIFDVTSQYNNILCIRGYDLVPHDSLYFADLKLHPNDNGFEHYSKKLYKEVTKN